MEGGILYTYTLGLASGKMDDETDNLKKVLTDETCCVYYVVF